MDASRKQFLLKQINTQLVQAENASKNGNIERRNRAYQSIVKTYEQLIIVDPENLLLYRSEIENYTDLANGASVDAPQSNNNYTNNNSVNEKRNNSLNNNQDIKTENKTPENKRTLNPNEKIPYEHLGIIDRNELRDAMNEIDGLIGLDDVKRTLKKWISNKTIELERTQRGLKNASLTYHMVFVGNPGTGKTTVALLVSKIYHALGIFKTDKCVSVVRNDLVGQYQGHTADKTTKVLESALDGVLFIDEVYQLNQGDGDSFGQEARETILPFMDNNRMRLAVIVAGYKKEMNDFLESNSGFKSRFKNFVEFTDYNEEELLEILIKIIKNSDYSLTKEAIDELKKVLGRIYAKKTSKFGNARFMRNISEDLIVTHNGRISTNENRKSLSNEEYSTITKGDVLSYFESEEFERNMKENL